MKVILDIKDSKAAFVMELLNNLSFVKAKPVSKENEELMNEISEAVENLNLAKKGMIRAKPINELLDEL
ncbi:MAG TPA: hypothetical protein VJ909_07295 [Prolixibacteraceae bacterium]|jgi:hypothetical protein|nr:hypothetical protein [Prolixibacteraceae bacterium]